MTVTATSPVAIAKAALRRLVASSATFQDVVGVTHEGAALKHVHIVEAIDDEDIAVDGGEGLLKLRDPRPRCLIDMTGNSVPLTGVGEYRDQYEFALAFEFPPDGCITNDAPGRNLLDESVWFDNQWSQIVEEMKTNNGRANADNEGYFAFTSIELVGGPMRNNPDEDPVGEYYWGVQLAIVGPHE